MSKLTDELESKIQKDIDLDRRKKALSEKDLTLKEHRVNRELDELVKNNKEIELANSITFGQMSQEDINQLVIDNNEYMDAAKNSMVFINNDFKKLVPYFRKNLILVGGDTGDGKSTSVANIVFSTITRVNPATGKAGRVLVLTNEEAREDFYNRVTCLSKGWAYTNHDQFTEEQRKAFSEHIPIWAANGRLTIIGDVHEGVSGNTTTPEGIEIILNNLLRDYHQGRPVYDAVILDYYQNVRHSKVDAKMNEYDAQRKLAGILDQMKIRYPGPIVVMAQMKKLVDEEDSTPFNVRLKGSKLICDKATFICEIIPQREYLRSLWKVWKSRFTDAIGNNTHTGYDRGRFVPYTPAFKLSVSAKVAENLERRQQNALPDGVVEARSVGEQDDGTEGDGNPTDPASA